MDPSKLPLFTRGRSLLSEALSPTTRRRFAGFLDTGTSSEESQMQSPFALSQTQSPAQQKPSPGRRTPSIRRRSALSDADFDRANTSDKSVVWIRCSSRPFRVRLALERGQVVVHGFERSVDKGKRGPPGDVERSGLVQVGDVLVGVNGQTRRFSTLEMAQMALASVEMPVELAFRRVLVVKETLGEYTEKHIVRYLMLQDSLLVRARGVQEAALLVQACIEVFGESKSTVPMGDYIEHVEKVVLPSLGILSDNVAYDRKIRFDQIKQVMETVHQRVDARRKTQVKAWNAAKSSNYRRIEILSRQRASIKERLEKMRENKKELQPENHTLWSEYIELRHLFTQLSENVEKSKQEHYLPDFEGYSLRFGSDGIYVGVGDIWIPSFHAKFSIETRSTAPHLSLHISTPSTHGLKIRVMNFTLATEGRLPSFHCDELNVEAQLVADIPLVFDSISGWTVPQEELDVKLMSFVYYERGINSTKRGKDHDTIMKMFINRMLPSVVRSAAQRLFCVELGPLIQHREAQVVLSGEIKISGRKLAVYDAALNNSNTEAKRATDQNLSETAREMMAISDDEAEVLLSIFKTFVDTHNNNKTLFGKVETPRLCIRNLISYFEQFHQTPHLKALASELWGQSIQLLSSASESPFRRDPGSSSHFAPIVDTIEQIKEYPVDVSISLVDVTFRLDLCDGAATYYKALQRIIRRSMDTSSVGLANLAELRDGTYLQNKLARLDNRYDKATKLLSHVATNVDVLGVIFRGVLPSGFMSRLFVEARDFSSKGPCAGSVTIPLTDLTALSSSDGVPVSSQNMSKSPPSTLTRTHENGALVLSRFLLDSIQDNGPDDEVELPSDRLKVAVKNPSVRVLFEVPSDVSQLEPGQTLTPFSVSVVTDEPNEPPKVKVETGDFGKCQYSAQSITLSGTVWQFLKRTQESADDVLRAEGAAASDGVSNPTSTQSGPSDAGEEGCIWDEYLESPFFSLRFHFFTSCQVSRDHVLLSVGSASLTEPKVAQLKHRVCLGQLLQDLDMLSVVDSNASRRKAGARFQHALRQRAVDTKRHGPSSVSNYSQRQTLFSQSSFTSLDDLDGTSEPASTYETEAHDSTPRQFFQREAADSSAVSSETSQATDFDALPPPIQPNIRSVDRQNSALFF
ncbi:hypothetical protein PF005_g12487 [Phytophthora fragariae]|uniref:PDZ domain-containing protein n=1 Tax=Phytophthora fragariae TaxID=53985 RepID=A0A6A3ES52_9STRA|nr:hypothetical protein PF003_g20536 [Phytophthora fragariae]KAE8936369.1 hypothetical protein PF009_g13714 [Phytophthora fragariae]KAE9108207.1 hypothetical protein PF007_g12755 [Phytophthora fragariae]KAE9143240.1 hypothetical protein PF006_g11720 [Phytophthora fragariae]KAE9207732.1 hypothetical protein PF005_g12487 [Phytophthora fragariae]